MRSIPRDEQQIKTWERHKKDINLAAAELKMTPQKLRYRLIAWGEYKPTTIQACRNCNRDFYARRNHVRCPECRRKEATRKNSVKRRRKLDVEKPEKVPPRWHDCRFYERCLNESARKSAEMDCRDCNYYSEISLKEQVAKYSTCVERKVHGFTPMETF
jgi:Zn finger protein HypA/HybF involved in hydrogenase expression